MTSISDTIAALGARRRARAPVLPPGADRLRAVGAFGANPGQLAAHGYLPEGLRPGAALVVVLHGCTQSAAAYDFGSGWSRLADRHGFALLFPEQMQANNPNRCFNWFQPGDAARGAGEVASIAAMIRHMLQTHRLDPARVFITGLSAGGAMAASLLACHPELFAAGAIIAGLPHGVARTVPEAFATMQGKSLPDAATLQRLLRAASPHQGPWPRVSIWQGDADATVSPRNAQALLAQWQGVHGSGGPPERLSRDGARLTRWHDTAGEPCLELWDVPGLAHGTPIDPAGDGLGSALPHMLDHGISSTAHIARFFGLMEAGATTATRPAAARARPQAASSTALPAAARTAAREGGERSEAGGPRSLVAAVLAQALPGRDGLHGSIKAVIDRALGRAGLQ